MPHDDSNSADACLGSEYDRWKQLGLTDCAKIGSNRRQRNSDPNLLTLYSFLQRGYKVKFIPDCRSVEVEDPQWYITEHVVTATAEQVAFFRYEMPRKNGSKRVVLTVRIPPEYLKNNCPGLVKAA